MNIENISNMSYTNKDFNSVYTELLEYANKLSYKWDPSTSDESDPGVVLLKLFSIVADKDNYNIDKNVLELMPASVTQLAAARQIFEQCGYVMPYYRSAIGSLQLTLMSEPELKSEDEKTGYKYTLPRFTMFSDMDNAVVYTSLEAATFNCPYDNKVAREKTETVDVIQGVVKDYTINNDPLITLSNLDFRNRLYFTENDIPENGIFISSYGQDFEDLSEWSRVDVLELTDPGTKCFRFGIDTESALCYIEFPNDVSSLIRDGINIKYVRSSGLTGNVAAKRITQLFTDCTYLRSPIISTTDSVSIAVDKSALSITNPLPISNGQDPESIDDAYRSYRRVKNTFDTLVSLKDYTDHMITSKHASNGFICDRTNDIQHVYSVLSRSENSNLLNKIIDKKFEKVKGKTEANDIVEVTVESDSLTAFDLVIYGLKYVDAVNTEQDYITSFSILSDADLRNTTTGYITYLNSDTIEKHVKCIQHNFPDEIHSVNKILMLKNKYPISAKIVPQYKLTQAQQFEVLDSITKNLFNKLNSKKIDFGASASFDTIYDAIITSDARIRSVSLDYPTYETYAIYKTTDGKYSEIRIDDNSTGGYRKITRDELKSNDFSHTLYKFIQDQPIEVSKDEAQRTWNIDYYIYDSNLAELWNDFRSEIFAKSILAGVTPLYTRDTQFTLGPVQSSLELTDPVLSVSTDTVLYGNYDKTSNIWMMNRKLETNENIVFTAPNYVTENQYSSYVKIIYDFPSLYNKNISHLRKDGIYGFADEETSGKDFIVFFWKTDAESTDYTYIKYSGEAASKASAISCSFALPAKQPTPSYTELFSSIHDHTENEIDAFWEAVIKHFGDENVFPSGKQLETSSLTSITYGDIMFTETALISKLSSTNNFNTLSGSKTIYTKKSNTIDLTDKEKGSDKFFWLLNSDSHITIDGKQKAVLFEIPLEQEGITENVQQRTLRNGEYLLYTNASGTSLYLLGEGTLIERHTLDKTSMMCDVIKYEDILQYGPTLLDGLWVYPSNSSLYATEMQINQIGPGFEVSITNASNRAGTKEFSNLSMYIDSTPFLLSREAVITYTDGKTKTTLPSIPDGWLISSLLNLNLSSDTPQQMKNSLYDKEGNKLEEDEENPTQLRYKQQIKLTDEDVITGNRYVLADSKLSLVGGSNIDVTTKDITGSRLTTFLSYIMKSFSASNENTETTDSIYKVTYPENSFYCTISTTGTFVGEIKLNKTTLLPGNYLIAMRSNIDLKNMKDAKLSLSFEDSDTDKIVMEPFYKEDASAVTTLYRVRVKDNKPQEVTPVVTLTADESITVTLEEFYKYSSEVLDNVKSIAPPENKDTSSNTSMNFEDTLIKKLKLYDVNREFDYLHPVDSGVLIQNPLVSNTFLNPSHIYNSFTICQWNIDEYDPEIEILNNVR